MWTFPSKEPLRLGNDSLCLQKGSSLRWSPCLLLLSVLTCVMISHGRIQVCPGGNDPSESSPETMVSFFLNLGTTSDLGFSKKLILRAPQGHFFSFLDGPLFLCPLEPLPFWIRNSLPSGALLDRNNAFRWGTLARPSALPTSATSSMVSTLPGMGLDKRFDILLRTPGVG
eukprot:1406655-Amphidinium_carterae.1